MKYRINSITYADGHTSHFAELHIFFGLYHTLRKDGGVYCADWDSQSDTIFSTRDEALTAIDLHYANHRAGIETNVVTELIIKP